MRVTTDGMIAPYASIPADPEFRKDLLKAVRASLRRSGAQGTNPNPYEGVGVVLQYPWCPRCGAPMSATGSVCRACYRTQGKMTMATRCIADCGCAGGQLAFLCTFEPDCSACRPGVMAPEE